MGASELVAGLISAPLLDLSSSLHDLAGRSSTVDALMTFAARDLLYGAILILAVLWTRERGIRAGLAAGLGALLALGISTVIGHIHYEPRPFIAQHFTPLFDHGADSSFPSDHLCALGAVTAGAWLGWRPLGVLAAVLSALVALARVYAGVHYLGDVLFGFAVGLLCGLLVWAALRPLRPFITRFDESLRRHHLRPWITG